MARFIKLSNYKAYKAYRPYKEYNLKLDLL
jgi:hypothetical protein